MSDTAPSKTAESQKPSKSKATSIEREPRPAFKPAKFGVYERQVNDYVKTATAKNIWYYRYDNAQYLNPNELDPPS